MICLVVVKALLRGQQKRINNIEADSENNTVQLVD